ncbi:MAG: protein kinase [Polyangiaceae bacterium]|nr:protein kinase [Polyangiaceae bacterium]
MTTTALDPGNRPGQDAESATSQPRGRVGQTLAERFVLTRQLGKGGMATVYEAQHRNGKRVAIKILHPELVHNEEILGRFLREGYAANAVKHPGVVSALDDGITEDGLPYMVLEFLEGESLEDRLERLGAPLELPDVLSIAVAVLNVLEAAHSRTIVHRDLKPDNLFLTVDGEVKVLDFGIARVADLGLPSTTRTGIAMGTATFMPREQAHGDLKRLDARADLWALGATLFYALTCRYLFEATTPVEFLAKLITSDPRPIGQVLPSLPGPIAAVIDRALQHDLARRWSSAVEMKQALLAAAADAGIAIPPSPSPCGYVAPTAPRIQVAAALPSLRRPLPSRPEGPEAPTQIAAPAPAPRPSGPLPAEAEPAAPARPAQSPALLGVAALLCLTLGAVAALWFQGRDRPALVAVAQATPSVSAALPVTSALPAPTPSAPMASASAVTSALPRPSPATPPAARPRSTPPGPPRSQGGTDLGSARQ